MAAAIETGEGVVTKSEGDAIKLEGWKSYLKYGNDYESSRPAVGQKVRVHYRPWENPTTKRIYYYLNEVEVLGPPPEAGVGAGPSPDLSRPQPEPGPGPSPVPDPSAVPRAQGPAPSYQASHDAAEARQDDAGPPAQDYAVDAGPKPGDYAYRDLSIQRQNRLNVAVQACVANLEQCPADQKAGRMITPDMIVMFERNLEQNGDGEMPPQDLPGGP